MVEAAAALVVDDVRGVFGLGDGDESQVGAAGEPPADLAVEVLDLAATLPPVSLPAERIDRFLRDNPSGLLWVTVGFASAFGLAWLNERTRGRPVRLLIGDTRTGFANYSEADRRAAIRFIQRPDVSVRNWYRKHGGYRTAHAKTWMVEPDPNAGAAGGVLVGSANLTRQGLLHNVEMLTLADPSEHRRLRAEIHDVMDESWPIEDRLLGLLGVAGAGSAGRKAGSAPTRRYSEVPLRSREHPPRTGSRQSHRESESRAGPELRRGVGMIAAGVVLLFVLFAIMGRSGDSDPTDGPESPAVDPSPLPAPTSRTAPDPRSGPEATTDSTVESPGDDSPPPAVPTTLADRPEIQTSTPPEGWTPEVGGTASSFGEPDRDDLQWVAWQPNCQSCEAGATLSWVGSYAYPFNRPPVGFDRPKLQSACLHRVRSGPLIDWDRAITGDRVESLWIDGESVPTGSWWIGGGDRNLMIPEPEPFLELLHGAQQLRVLTAGGLDATFIVAGFLTTPVQPNLDHCGHYA